MTKTPTVELDELQNIHPDDRQALTTRVSAHHSEAESIRAAITASQIKFDIASGRATPSDTAL